MKMKRFVVKTLTTALFLTHFGANAGEMYTLDQMLELARANSPILKTAAAQRQVAEASVKTAGGLLNPEVEFMTGKSRARLTDGTSGQVTSVTITQPFQWASVREARIRGAEYGVKAAESNYTKSQLEVESDIKKAFFEVIKRWNEQKLAQENSDILQQIRDKVALRVKVGEVARYELVKAEAELSAALNITRSAKLRVNEAKAILRAMTGLPITINFEVDGKLAPHLVLPDIQTLRQNMLSRHPQVQQSSLEVQQAQSQIDLQRALKKPAFALKGGMDQSPDARQYQLGFTVTLPLLNQNQGPLAEAQAEKQRIFFSGEETRVRLLRELDSAFTQYIISDRQVESYETGLLKEAEYALKVAETAYRYGERGILDYLDAQRTYRSIRADYNTALFERQFALIELERLRALPLKESS